MTIDNGVVVLPDGLPVKLRFSAMRLADGRRKDPDTGFESSVKRFVAQVVEMNGQPMTEILDTLAEGLWQKLLPYAGDANLSNRQFTITKTGSDYVTKYTVAVQ